MNLRDALGVKITGLVPPASSRVADDRIGMQIQDAPEQSVRPAVYANLGTASRLAPVGQYRLV